MKYLIDKSPEVVRFKAESPLVLGQLLTPLTRYRYWGGPFAIDNGAFSGFDAGGFARLLDRMYEHRSECLFVACPDVVASARRTLELFRMRRRWVPQGWRVALVAQDGMEDLDVPWSEMGALFIGGGDPWKDSKAALDLVRTAKIIGIHVHVGRVNTPGRYRRFTDLGADTCDGSGVSMYDHMLAKITHDDRRTLWGEDDGEIHEPGAGPDSVGDATGGLNGNASCGTDESVSRVCGEGDEKAR